MSSLDFILLVYKLSFFEISSFPLCLHPVTMWGRHDFDKEETLVFDDNGLSFPVCVCTLGYVYVPTM